MCEWYGNGGARDRPAAAFSVSKTVPSLLVFRAVEEGAVTARDLARIGQLMLDDGRVDGRQVAPRAFVERSLRGPGRDEPVTTFAGVAVGYRNGWWLLPGSDGGHDLAAMGAHGQIMVVSPTTRTVLVRMGDDSALTNIEIAVALQKAADHLGFQVDGTA